MPPKKKTPSHAGVTKGKNPSREAAGKAARFLESNIFTTKKKGKR